MIVMFVTVESTFSVRSEKRMDMIGLCYNGWNNGRRGKCWHGLDCSSKIEGWRDLPVWGFP